jgi:hypothetical protein
LGRARLAMRFVFFFSFLCACSAFVEGELFLIFGNYSCCMDMVCLKTNEIEYSAAITACLLRALSSIEEIWQSQDANMSPTELSHLSTERIRHILEERKASGIQLGQAFTAWTNKLLEEVSTPRFHHLPRDRISYPPRLSLLKANHPFPNRKQTSHVLTPTPTPSPKHSTS